MATMTSFKNPSFQDRARQAAEAKEKALNQLRLRPDPDQKRGVEALDRLAAELAQAKSGVLAKLFGRKVDAPHGVPFVRVEERTWA